MENVSDGTQNAPYSQVEFVIDMASDESFKTVQQSLKGMQGVKSADLNLETRQVVVNSNLPVEELREMIADKTGHRVVLLGFGVSREHTENLQLSAAVAAIQNCATHSSIAGVVRFTESSTEVTRDSNSATKLIADGVIDGLKVDGQYCVAVHRNGDVTDEATSCGGVFEAPPTNKPVLLTCGNAYGVLSRLRGENIGRLAFRNELSDVQLWQLIGRSVVVHQVDDVAHTQLASNAAEQTHPPEANSSSKGSSASPDLNLTRRIAYGIVARAAGIFENSKRLCTCSGSTIWQEYDEAQSKSKV